MKKFIANNVCNKNEHNWELGQDERNNNYWSKHKQWKCHKCHLVKTTVKDHMLNKEK